MIPYTQELWGNGGIGAAITTIITELFIMVVGLGLLPKENFNGFGLSMPAKGILSGAVMFSLVWGLNTLNIFWIIQAVLGLLVYLGCSVMLNIITQNEIQFFKNFLINNKNKYVSILKTKAEQI
jgi:hypothetical protein